ncbi:hypothetical protein B0H11DRAFT_2135295 [Mycena galericulata]|nr:hypothetical protein B0H11DRAFT_2135295 [Mycena galericulata]
MSIIAPRTKGSEIPPPTTPQETTAKLPMTDDGRPFRIATNTHYRKGTMWDLYRPPGTWGFLPRFNLNETWRVHEWDRDLDGRSAALPSPWAFYDRDPDDSENYHAAELQRKYGTQALTRVMHRCTPHIPYTAVAFSTPEGRFYVEDLNEDLWEFEGTYRSVDDFIENADWNKMHIIYEIDDASDAEYEEDG